MVVGVGSTIGRACAERLAADGAAVLVVDPDARVTAARAVLTQRGRLVEGSGPEGGLDRRTRRALASLAASAARALGT